MQHIPNISPFFIKMKSYSLFLMQVKTIVFDKTGTLTIGKPTVVSAVLFSGFSMEVLCDMAISIEVFFLCCILYLFGHLNFLYSFILVNIFEPLQKIFEEYRKRNQI